MFLPSLRAQKGDEGQDAAQHLSLIHIFKQFDQARQMMKQMMGGGKKRLRMPFGKFRG